MTQINDVLRDSKRMRLIATALELLHFERDDSAVIPIPGTDPQRYVTIGTAATVAQLLEIARDVQVHPVAEVVGNFGGEGLIDTPLPIGTKLYGAPGSTEGAQAQQDAVKLDASQSVPQAWREFASAIRNLPVGAEPNLDGMRAKARQLLANEERRAQESGGA